MTKDKNKQKEKITLKKLVTSIRKNRKLQAHRKQLWKNIMDIHNMF